MSDVQIWHLHHALETVSLCGVSVSSQLCCLQVMVLTYPYLLHCANNQKAWWQRAINLFLLFPIPVRISQKILIG